MYLTKSQQNIVDKLFAAFLNREKHRSVAFKAPTGAGKTFICSELISRIFSNEWESDKRTVIAVATVSSADLPRQFAKKLMQYRGYHDFNQYEVEFIQSPSKNAKKIEDIKEFELADNKIFVFGVSSFGKNTLFYRNKTLDIFWQNALNNNYQVIFIRDEAHIGIKEKISKEDLKKFDNQMRENAIFIMEMTATPKKSTNLIEMKEGDMDSDDCFLLKTIPERPRGLSAETTNEELIDNAIKEFIKSKKAYATIKDCVINPAMLIQVMNESDIQKNSDLHRNFQENLDLIEKKLQLAGLKYLKYLGSPKVVGTNVPKTLDYASQLDSQIDVVIFKVGPATGWDIPRANMLLQIRNVSSENLNVQTIGRIKRNPYPGLKKNAITDKYYLYSNYQQPTRAQAYYVLKKRFENMNFISGGIDIKNKVVQEKLDNYKKDVIELIKSKTFINAVKDLQNSKIIYDSMDYLTTSVINKIPNYIILKIFNLKKEKYLENKFHLSFFSEALNQVSKDCKKNIEKVKYLFYTSFLTDLQKIKAKNAFWERREPYKLSDSVKAMKNYSIWIDNHNSKFIQTDKIENYGYQQITDIDKKKDLSIQYLDSQPEHAFFKSFLHFFSSQKMKKISFFAKMPTLGSPVYFEYYSSEKGKITKSYVDFAVKYKNRWIMFEVKSLDSDYDENKTEEILNAYEKYMQNFGEKKFSLVVFQIDKTGNKLNLNFFKNKKWVKDESFGDCFDYLFQ